MIMIDSIRVNNQENGLGEPAVKYKFKAFIFICAINVFFKVLEDTFLSVDDCQTD